MNERIEPAVAAEIASVVNSICVWTNMASEAYAKYAALRDEHIAARAPSNIEKLVSLRDAAFNDFRFKFNVKNEHERTLRDRFGIELPGIIDKDF